MLERIKAHARLFIRNAVSGDLAAIAERIPASKTTQEIAQDLMTTPTIWPGDWSKVSLGNNVHAVNALFNVSSGNISVGDDTFFGHNVSLITGTHNIESTGAERQLYPDSGRDIAIGKGVWIASNVAVLGPCSIGDNAIIAAGAVVKAGTSVEAGATYAGVPAKRVK